MEEEKFGFEDESNDRKYFSLLPHYILNHSSAIDQALYMQMKRFAGEKRDGLCWASKKTLLKKMQIGKDSLNKSLEYLLKRGWITYKGKRKVSTAGGDQEVDVYSIKDIWKENIEYYEGGSETAYLSKGGLENAKGGLKPSQGGSETAPNKNHIKQEDNNTDFPKKENTASPLQGKESKLNIHSTSDTTTTKETLNVEEDSIDDEPQYENTDEDGNVLAPVKKSQDPDFKEKANKMVAYWQKRAKEELGFVPEIKGAYFIIQKAIKANRLKWRELKVITDEWWDDPKLKDEEKINFSWMLSYIHVNKYKLHHRDDRVQLSTVAD